MIWSLITVCMAFSWIAISHADDSPIGYKGQAPAEVAEPLESDSERVPERILAKRKIAKGKRTREKEAEGTQARNRFETDSIIKSKYTIDGQSIEVDPD